MRIPRGVTLLAPALLLVSCAVTPATSPSATPPAIDATPAPGTSQPAPSPTQNAESAGCSEVTAPVEGQQLAPGTLAEIVTDDLVMRTAPRIADDSAILPIRLDAPDIVYVEGGPVAADGYEWYLVSSDGEPDLHGWVAAGSREGEAWLRSLGAEGQWCLLAVSDLPIAPDLRSAAAGPDGRIYLLGGNELNCDGFCVSGRFFAFDPRTASWSELPPIPGGPGDVALHEGRLWVVTRPVDVVVESQPSAAHAYDPGSETWSALPEVPLPVYQLAVHAGRVRAIGDRGVATYDPVSMRWDVVAMDQLAGQVGPIVAGVDNRSYRLSPEGGIGPIDPQTLELGAVARARLGRYSAALTSMADGRLMVVGGYPAGPCALEHGPVPIEKPAVELDAGLRLAEAFDPSTGEWKTLAPLPKLSGFHYQEIGAVRSGSDVYVLISRVDAGTVAVARYLPEGGAGVADEPAVFTGARGCGGEDV